MALAAALGNGPYGKGGMVRAAEQQAEASASITESPADKPAAPALSESERAAATAAVEGLLAALGDEDREVRVLALKKLNELLRNKDFDALKARVKERKKAAAFKMTPFLRRVASKLHDHEYIERLLAAEENELLRNKDFDALKARVKERKKAAAFKVTPLLRVALHAKEDIERLLAAEEVAFLGATGLEYEAVKALVPVLIRARIDENLSVLDDAEEALKKIGSVAVPALIDALKDEDQEVRRAAAWTLENIGPAAKDAVPALIEEEELQDENKDVRKRSASELVDIGPAAKDAVPALIDALKDENKDVRKRSASELGNIGPAAKDAVPALIDALKDKNQYVRLISAKALGAMGPAAKDAVPALMEKLEDEYMNMRKFAADALGRIGPSAADAEQLLVDMMGNTLSDGGSGEDFHIKAFNALVSIGLADRAEKEAARLLMRGVAAVRRSMRNACSQYALRHPVGSVPFYHALNASFYNADEASENRLLAYLLSGGQAKKVAWVRRAAIPSGTTFAPMDEKEAKALLNYFNTIWEEGAFSPALQENIAKITVTLAKAHPTLLTSSSLWTKALILAAEASEVLPAPVKETLAQFQAEMKKEAQEGVLAKLTEKFEKAKLGQASELTALAKESLQEQLILELSAFWALHSVLWAALIWCYPYSSFVQGIFFWNPAVRGVCGFGYVSLLLRYVPFLRARMFRPFRTMLLMDAGTEDLRYEYYYGKLQARAEPGDETLTLDAAAEPFKVQVLLEGESGSGKTMFLRRLATQSPRLCVYLPAALCKAGVVEAVLTKVEDPVKDEGFLKTLIHAGALDIYIDGLNETDAETRASICTFARQFPAVRMVMTLQRVDGWTPPPAAKRYIMQRPCEERIREFLMNCHADEAYRARCKEFLDDCFTAEAEGVEAYKRQVLANPLDLSIVAEMLKEGLDPDLNALVPQLYARMAGDYRERVGHDFPLDTFGDEVFDNRLNDKPDFSAEGREVMFDCFEKHKMIIHSVTEYKAGGHNSEVRVRKFRHDKIMDFFLCRSFQLHKERIPEHLGDSRFRGAYVLLADRLSLTEARQLNETFNDYGVETSDRLTGDEVHRLVRAREARATSASA